MRGAGRERTVELRAVVDLDERLEAGLAAPSRSRLASSASLSAATIRSTASAPAARASHSCQASTTKSFRSTGSVDARPRLDEVREAAAEGLRAR